MKKQELSNFDDRPDELNPRFLFSTTSTTLLVESLNKVFDVNELIKNELVNRGVDANGRWVGFNKAAKLHKVKVKC
jgi:hypothetical protein